MPAVVVAGVTIKVNSASWEYEELGDRGRAFDGTMLSTIRTRKKRGSFTTPAVPVATADTYQTALIASPPVTLSGDASNGVTSVHPQLTGREQVLGTAPSVRREVLSFTLMEA